MCHEAQKQRQSRCLAKGPYKVANGSSVSQCCNIRNGPRKGGSLAQNTSIFGVLMLVNIPRTTEYNSVGNFILELNIKMTILIMQRST